ncbi:hypothetical protein [Tunturibacter empetritectus]|uniref:Uncharacterized protein n=1 Tax=Tunturiibacter empetritectus TaxID=3069691 RepID=A0A7W8IHT3_9BACT|nr:hypothetical protein [Edaphobacter lichenicola]MBB5317420.1 hypothetical protein [Edaphobacter lichenicola]
MQNISQTLPASLRSVPSVAKEDRSAPKPDRRPYIVPVRKPATSTRKYLSLFPHESEDARLTGATRSLYRRLLALNLPRPVESAELPPPREAREMRITVIAPKTA